VQIHAVRGRHSATALRRSNIEVPDVYGDPVLFLPKIVDPDPPAKLWELGVIVDAPELEKTPDALPDASIKRYAIPPELQSSIRLVNIHTGRGARAVLDKIGEIRSCKRIATLSVTGLIVAEALKIPCAWFARYPGGHEIADIDDMARRIEPRVRDFYSGAGKSSIAYFGGGPNRPTDWDRLTRAIDESWTPLEPDLRPLFEAFPLRKTVSFDNGHWPLDWATLDTIAI
jgi:pyruvyltransferase